MAVVWIAAPWAALSGATPHDYARWEKEITAYERQDRTNPPPKGAVLFIGSSTVRLWKTLAGDFPATRVLNRGFGGSQIVDATHFADRIVFPYAPRQIFLRAGGNDLWAGKSAAQVFAEYQEFVQQIHARLPETEIVFIALSPSPSRWKQAAGEKDLNHQVEAFSRGRKGLRYVEAYDLVLDAAGQPREELFVADKLHFNAQGYKLLAERVRPAVSKDAP